MMGIRDGNPINRARNGLHALSGASLFSNQRPLGNAIWNFLHTRPPLSFLLAGKVYGQGKLRLESLPNSA